MIRNYKDFQILMNQVLLYITDITNRFYYQSIVTNLSGMFRGAANLQQADSIQRDALISALKKELYQLQDRQHEHLALNDQINKYETQYSMLKDEKDRIQNEHRIKTDLNRKNIGDLRAQIDGTKMQIHKCSVQIEDILRESAGIKRMAQNKENQIASLMSANQQIQAKNQQLVEENKNKVNKIKSLKQERNRCDADNEKLHRILEESINNLKKLQKQARMIESQNSKLSNILTLAEKDYQDLREQMKSRNQMVSTTNKKLDQLNKEIEDLKDKTTKLEKQCLKNQQELRNTAQVLQLSISKNKQQAKRLKQLQNQMRGVQNQLDKAILQRDALQNDHASLQSQHNLLNTEIDSVLLQIIEYQKINKQLSNEIEHYILCDDEARNMLNRKEVMKNLLDTVNARLNQTGENIAHLR